MEQLDIDRIENDARSSGKANLADVLALTQLVRKLRVQVEKLEARRVPGSNQPSQSGLHAQSVSQYTNSSAKPR